MKRNNINKKFLNAPLPYQGQKRYFIKDILRLLEDWKRQQFITKETIFLDVFGGSGLIAHHIKQAFVNNRVIWNDYDNYQQRLDHIDDTNLLRAQLYDLCQRQKADINLGMETKKRILQIISRHQCAGYFTDYLTLSSWLLFSSRYEKELNGLEKPAFYSNKVIASDISAAGYLAGVERVSTDFTCLLDKFQHDRKIQILDPPYLQTQTENAYRHCWKLSEFLQLSDRIQPPYILFGNQKSGIKDFFGYMGNKNPAVFADYQQTEKQVSSSGANRYLDYLLYKVAA